MKQTFNHRTTTKISSVVSPVVVLLLLLLCGQHHHFHADAATSLVPCPSGEITSVFVLDGGLDYELYDCKVHGTGQIVVNGTVGASLRLERVQLTDPAGDFSVWVDGTSVPVRLTVVNSIINSTAGLNEGSVVVWNAIQSGNVVDISNNIFAGRSTITFGNTFKLDHTSSIAINDNDLSQMTKGTDAPSPRYSTSTPCWVLINTIQLYGGSLTMLRNSLSSSGVLTIPLRQYTVDSTLSLLVVKEYHINPSSDPAAIPPVTPSVTLLYNYGFYPLVQIDVQYISDNTPLHFNISHNVGNFIDMAGGLNWIEITAYSINPPPGAAFQDIIATISNNTLEILWRTPGGVPYSTFLKLYGLLTTICNFENNFFNFTIDGEFSEGSSYARLVTVSQEYEEINVINNTFIAIMKDAFYSGFMGVQIEKVRKVTMSKNNMTIVNVSTADILYYRQITSGDILNTTYLRVTHNYISIIASPYEVELSGDYRGNFISLYADLELFWGYVASISDNTFTFTSNSLVGGGPSLARHFKRMVVETEAPTGPLSLLFNKNINAPQATDIFSAAPIFDVSRNIVGSPESCNYTDAALFPQIGGVAFTSLSAAGCYNWICGQRVADISGNYTNLNWTSCVTPSASLSRSTSLLPPKTNSASPTMPINAVITHTTTNIVVPPPVPVIIQEDSEKKSVVRFEPTKASVPVEVSGTVLGVVAVATVGTVGSGPMIEAAPALQVWAMYSLMSCQIDGEQPSTAKRLLAPLTFTDYDSADLMGSLTIVIGGSLLYYAIAHLVFAVVRRCTPTAAAPADGQSVEDWEEEQWVLERRMQRAKLLLLYPRVPVLLVTVLFTGITYDSCRLLYGSAKDTAAVWERVLGGLCLASAVAFVVYHAWVGWRVHRMLKEAAASEDGNEDDGRKPLSPRDNHLAGPPGNGECVKNSEDRIDAFSRSHSASSSSHHHLVSPRDVAEDVGSDVLEMPAMVPSNRFSPAASPDHESATLHIHSGKSPDADAPLILPADGRVKPLSSSPKNSDAPIEDTSATTTTVLPQQLDFQSLDKQGKKNPTAKIPTAMDDEANEDLAPKVISTTNPNDEEVWSVFKPEEKEMFPVAIAATLCGSGKWSIAISRSRYCVVTAMRPEYAGCLCMTSSCLVRSAAVCIAAAVVASNQDVCDTVYGILASISFIHAVFLLVLRPYRIPALNPLNALQSLLLGLLACTQFMGSETAQVVLSVLFMTACVVTIVLCAVSTFLDFLINRRRAKIAQEKSGGLTFRGDTQHMDI